MPNGSICLNVTLVRHAQTDMNCSVPRILQGQSETPINAFGVKQARAVAWRLGKQTFDFIYTSDLIRANETATIIKDNINLADVPLITDERLREQALGELTGMPWADAKQLLKEKDVVFQDYVQKTGGESALRFQDRVIDFYTSLIDNHLIKPHRELMNSIALANASLTSTPVERLPARKNSDLLVIPGQIQEPHSPTRTNLTEKMDQLVTQNSLSQIATSTLLLKPVSTAIHPHQETPQHPTYRPKMKCTNVLIVTHGGWIQELMDHLIHELGFTLQCDKQNGFPKNTGVYQFSIVKVWKDDGDYEWEGRITRMNCVSHFAGISKKRERTNNGSREEAKSEEKKLDVAPRSPAMLRKSPHLGSNSSGLVNSAMQLAMAVSKMGSAKQNTENKSSAARKLKSLGW